MTTYILAGGADTSTPGYIESLASVLGLLTRDITDVSVLGCSFSQPREERRDRFKYFLPYYKQLIPGAEYVDAIEETFFDQLDRSDVVYFRGGSTERLLETLPDFEKVKRKIQGKIVVGSSAGANYLSSYCYSVGAGKVSKGSGILSKSVCVHYGAKSFEDKDYTIRDWQSIAKQVVAKSDQDEIICLPEGQFSVVSA